MPSPFEFPTDNPSLFTARPPSVFPAAPEVAAEPPAEAAALDEDVTERPPVAAALEAVTANDEAPASIDVVDAFDDAFFAAVCADDDAPSPTRTPADAYMDALIATARDAGASADAAMLLSGLLGFARLDVTAATPETVDRLVCAGLLVRRGDAVVRDEATASIALAWREALLDRDPDLAVCGGAMLDEWSARLLARLAGCPERVDVLRRTLRGRGVAAFGMLVDAA